MVASTDIFQCGINESGRILGRVPDMQCMRLVKALFKSTGGGQYFLIIICILFLHFRFHDIIRFPVNNDAY